MRAYTSLGAVPMLAKRQMEGRDALLAKTGPAARAVLKEIRRLPSRQQIPELNRTLREFDPNLPATTQTVAAKLVREGMPINLAMERALALSLADASIEQIKQLGYRVRRGEQVPFGALGGLGLGAASDEIGRMAEGIACSSQLRDSVTNLVGAKEGADAHDATRVGFDFAAAVATCPTPATPGSTTVVEEAPSYVIPALIGAGALLAVGGIVWATRKKK